MGPRAGPARWAKGNGHMRQLTKEGGRPPRLRLCKVRITESTYHGLMSLRDAHGCKDLSEAMRLAMSHGLRALVQRPS
jgi:hypothetical protein